MVDFGLKEERLNAIRNVLARYPQVKRAVIFGSRARGDYQYNSDIDLAIYLNDTDNRLPSALYLDLDESAGIYKIDIVNMNTLTNAALRQRIEEQGEELVPVT